MRPSMDDTLLEMARVMALRGTCSRAQVGVVIARDGRVCATGYNGAPRGMKHCVHPSGELSNARPVDAAICRWSTHAEANAVAFAARHGVALLGSTMYTTLTPCVVCAQLAVNTGIVAVICDRWYRDQTGVNLLIEAGVSVNVINDPEST